MVNKNYFPQEKKYWEDFFSLMKRQKSGAFLEKEIGRKGSSLIELLNLGLPVPAGVCVKAGVLDSILEKSPWKRALQGARDQAEESVDALLKEIRLYLEEVAIPDALGKKLSELADSGKAWAVRSSGLKEDLGDSSFAGQYRTLLNVKGDQELKQAVRLCWASCFNYRVYRYLLNRGEDFKNTGMGVVIQEMVVGEKSGVLVSVNPLTGSDREFVIEACTGLGEALVEGEVTPDQYIYNWYHDLPVRSAVRNDLPVLCPEEVKSLSALALRILDAYGYPVDVEWTCLNGEFYLLQARPVTSINFNALPGQWTTADFKDGGVSSSVCSPLMWSLYDFVWEKTVPEYLSSARLDLHLSFKERRSRRLFSVMWGNMFYGRPYWNAGEVKACIANVPGFKEREFDEDLGIQVGYEGSGRITALSFFSIVKGSRILRALKRSFKKRLAYNRRFHPAMRQRLEKLEEIKPEGLNDADLFSFFTALIREDYFRTESSYFLHVFDNSNVQTLFKDLIKKYRGRINYLNLILGLQNLSHLLPNYSLWTLSRRIRLNQEAITFFQTAPVREICALLSAEKGFPFSQELKEYLWKNRYHSTRELDITVPNYREDPSFVIANLKNQLTLPDESDPELLNSRQNNNYQIEKERLLNAAPGFKRKELLRTLEEMRSFLWWREELRDLSSRMYDQIRRFVLEVGRRLCGLGILEKGEDLFFLPLTDIFPLLKEPKQAEAYLIKEKVRKNRIYYRSFRNFKNPPDIGFIRKETVNMTGGGRSFSGIPCSPGIVRGRVKVVASIADTGSLKKGDILVTKYTDPGWTPVFALLSGVITETGGVLSHAAVIAREYGIPAVLAVEGITTVLKNNWEIILDGDTGKIIISGEQEL